MAKTPSSERTSVGIARIAGQLLNGQGLQDAEAWLQGLADDVDTTEDVRGYAVVLLGTLGQVRRVAASALTQR